MRNVFRKNPLDSRLTAQWYINNLQEVKGNLKNIIENANLALNALRTLDEDEYKSLRLFEKQLSKVCDANDNIDVQVKSMGTVLTKVYEQGNSDGFVL